MSEDDHYNIPMAKVVARSHDVPLARLATAEPREQLLDYASPRKRTNTRLEAKSIIVLFREQSDLVVRETLTGQASALVGIILTPPAVLLANMAAWYPVYRHGYRASETFNHVFGVATLLMLVATIILIPKVIRSTWRKTILRVGVKETSLTFAAPLTENQIQRWASHFSRQATVELTHVVPNQEPLGELRIATETHDVHLFTDHPVGLLHEIVRQMKVTGD